jgi:predicted negative regulator of RcsB-dependent stress response
MSYLTDEEKAEAIKKWWKDNGSAVVGGLILGGAGLFGWNWWTDRQETRGEAASEMYMTVLSHVEAGQYTHAAAVAGELAERGRGTPYAAMGWALMADVAERQEDTERAIVALEEARATAHDQGYRQILSLRLARSLIAAGRLDAAEPVLDEVTAAAFQGLRAELRGDLARARNQPERARTHYEEAVAAGHNTEFLRLKIDELSG